MTAMQSFVSNAPPTDGLLIRYHHSRHRPVFKVDFDADAVCCCVRESVTADAKCQHWRFACRRCCPICRTVSTRLAPISAIVVAGVVCNECVELVDPRLRLIAQTVEAVDKVSTVCRLLLRRQRVEDLR